MREAIEGRRDSPLKLLAITVPTGLDGDDVREPGYDCPVEELVSGRVGLAMPLGMDAELPGSLEAVR